MDIKSWGPMAWESMVEPSHAIFPSPQPGPLSEVVPENAGLVKKIAKQKAPKKVIVFSLLYTS